MLWYTAFQFFILTWWKDIIETYNQSIFNQYSGLISLAEIIIIIAVWLCPLIWIIKSYNLLLEYRPNNKFFVKKWWIAGILRCIPIVCLYTKFRILKDLYFNLTEEKRHKKRTFYTRYIFYLLARGFFIIHNFVSWMSDTNLLETVKINSLITSLLATIAIPTFNNIVGIIWNFYETFNIIKWVTNKENKDINKNEEKINNEVIADTINNEVIADTINNEEVKVKKFNLKKLLYIILGIVILLSLIVGILSINKNKSLNIKAEQNNSIQTAEDRIAEDRIVENRIEEWKIDDKEIEENKINNEKNENVNNITPEQQMFENNIKCQEYLYNFKSEFWTWYKNFSTFFSPKLNTCLVWYEYEWYEFIGPWNRNHDIIYYIDDMFNRSSWCKFANRMELYYPNSITDDRNYSIESQIKICNCENIEEYDKNDIKLCNLWVGDIKTLRWNEIVYLKWDRN